MAKPEKVSFGSIRFPVDIYTADGVDELVQGIVDSNDERIDSLEERLDSNDERMDGLEDRLSSVYRYKGSVLSYSELPSEGMEPGDVYNVEDGGMNYAWAEDSNDQGHWDPLGPSLAGYATKEYVDSNDQALRIELAGKASVADATLNGRGFGEWTFSPSSLEGGVFSLSFYSDEQIGDHWFLKWTNEDEGYDEIVGVTRGGEGSTSLSIELGSYMGLPSPLEGHYGETVMAVKAALPGYVLGSQTEKPIPKLSDVPAVVAPSTDASAAGKASDAKATGDALDAIKFKEWFPGGEAKSISDCTSGLKFDWANVDSVNHVVNVLPFCDTGSSDANNSDKAGRVVIPPYVDHEGVRYAVVGVASGNSAGDDNSRLTGIVAPTTVTSIGDGAFDYCYTLTSVSLPAATSIGGYAFGYCYTLTSVSFPAVTSIGDGAFEVCTALASVDFGPDARSSVPTLGTDAFPDLSQSGHTCRIVVPDSQYAEWTTASGWAALMSMGYEFVRHSETEPAERGDIELSANYSDTPTFSKWTVLREGVDATSSCSQPEFKEYYQDSFGWVVDIASGFEDEYVSAIDQSIAGEDATTLTWTVSNHDDPQEVVNVTYIATRQRTDVDAYRLGPDASSNPNRDRLLASAESTEVHLPEGPTEGYTEWVFSDVSPSGAVTGQPYWYVGESAENWVVPSNALITETSDLALDESFTKSATELRYDATIDGVRSTFIATRRPKYVTIGNSSYRLVTKEWMDEPVSTGVKSLKYDQTSLDSSPIVIEKEVTRYQRTTGGGIPGLDLSAIMDEWDSSSPSSLSDGRKCFEFEVTYEFGSLSSFSGWPQWDWYGTPPSMSDISGRFVTLSFHVYLQKMHGNPNTQWDLVDDKIPDGNIQVSVKHIGKTRYS